MAGPLFPPVDARVGAGFECGGTSPASNMEIRCRTGASASVSPEVVLHPDFGSRSEVKSSGRLRILVAEDLRSLTGAELCLELWGGHPGTANKRVTPNGRTIYPLPEVGTAAANCTDQYPIIPLKLTDLVSRYTPFSSPVSRARRSGGTLSSSRPQCAANCLRRMRI